MFLYSYPSYNRYHTHPFSALMSGDMPYHNAIDGEGVEEIRSLILSLKNEKRIIIVACHDKEEMNLLADEIVHLRDGRIEGQENGGAA